MLIRNLKIIPLYLALTCAALLAQGKWVPDKNDGSFKNPVIYADYSDPDVIRVGDKYYLVSSSFSNFPGLPVLESADLVNWKIISHAAEVYPADGFDRPQHGNGIWAPSIRFHNNEFYIYFGDPDNGIYMTRSRRPEGPWAPLKLIKNAKGWIDPCPFWDKDGTAYLVHAWANSRAGIKSILTINKMNNEGTEILDEGVMVFDGRKTQPTIEGPKIYFRSGYYYIFAPAGGVKPGWQAVLRSKNIYGPYEEKIVLEQGSTKINGPHQGAWIVSESGEDWFIHFQDKGAFGRIVHLQPLKWINGWPVIGIDYDGNGIGEPVTEYKMPLIKKSRKIVIPQTDDEFNGSKLGLQWQWEANFDKKWYSLDSRKGFLRLNIMPPVSDYKNLYDIPNLPTQKFPSPNFTAETKVSLKTLNEGDKAGLIILGADYSYIALEKKNKSFQIIQAECIDADKEKAEQINEAADIADEEVIFSVKVNENGVYSFSYSMDGKNFIKFGKEFTARAGRWVGAKAGLFTVRIKKSNQQGCAYVDWFRIK